MKISEDDLFSHIARTLPPKKAKEFAAQFSADYLAEHLVEVEGKKKIPVDLGWIIKKLIYLVNESELEGTRLQALKELRRLRELGASQVPGFLPDQSEEPEVEESDPFTGPKLAETLNAKHTKSKRQANAS